MAEGNGMEKRGLDALAQALAVTMIAALCSCHQESAHAPPAAPPPPVKAADVNAERLAAGEPCQWVTPRRGPQWTFYFPLKNINARHLAQLCFSSDHPLAPPLGPR